MRTLFTIVVGALSVMSLGIAERSASADAIEAPPKDCPPGQVGTSDHGGARCELEAPKDCPPGWRGVQGGQCMLAACGAGDHCAEGFECRVSPVCLEPVMDEYYDYGEEPERKHGGNEGTGERGAPASLLGDGPLLAGPPMPRTKRATPITRYNAVNLCAPGVTCASPRTCQDEKICVPKGKSAMAYSGKNVGPARVSRTTDVPLTASSAKSTITEVAPPTTPSTARKGCMGCAMARTEPNENALGVLALGSLAAVFAWRRRSQKA